MGGASGLCRLPVPWILRPLRLDRALEAVLAELDTDRCTIDRQHAAVVALHQHAYGVAAVWLRHDARRGADPALPAEGHRARARTDGAFLHRTGRSGLECAHDVLRRDGACANVVQAAVVRLTDDRIDRSHVLHAR